MPARVRPWFYGRNVFPLGGVGSSCDPKVAATMNDDGDDVRRSIAAEVR